MARKKKHEEHENHERWLVSYADFITLLFAFFVVMYSISSVNEGKYRVLSDAMISAFTNAGQSFEPIMIGNPSASKNTVNRSERNDPLAMGVRKMPIPVKRPGSKGARMDNQPVEVQDARQQQAAISQGQSPSGVKDSLDQIEDEISGSLTNLINSDLLIIRKHADSLEVELKSKVLFQPGSARLSIESEKILIKLANIIARFPNSIQVEGHTDDTPVVSATYPSNWHLSASRAGSVTYLFAEHGVNPENLWAVGYGEYRPLVANDTLENRIKNRRVVLWIRGAQPEVEEPQPVFGDGHLNTLPESSRDAPDSGQDTQPSNLNNDPTSLNADQPTAVTGQDETLEQPQTVIAPIQLPAPTGFKPFAIQRNENTDNQAPGQGGQ